MPEANFTDLDKMMIFTAYKNGLKVGENISKAIESGELVVPDNETLEVILNSFYTYEYPMYQKVLAKIGSPEFSTAGNIGLTAGGLCLAGISTQNYFETKNPVAKVCYAASIVCSSTAMLTGGLTAFNNVCGISHLAMCGDAFGSTFLFLGNRAKNLGNYAEGKSKIRQLNPFRNRGFKRKPGSLTGYKGMGFITPGYSNTSLQEIQQIITNILYQEIIIIGSTIFTIYTYGKLIIAISRKLASKFSPKIDSSKLIQNQAVFLINILTYKRAVNRIYNFALS
jgi:hypothetical protein